MKVGRAENYGGGAVPPYTGSVEDPESPDEPRIIRKPSGSIYHDPFEDTERSNLHLNAAGNARVPSTTIRLRILKVCQTSGYQMAESSSIYHDPFEDTERHYHLKEGPQRLEVPSTTIRLRILKGGSAVATSASP